MDDLTEPAPGRRFRKPFLVNPILIPKHVEMKPTFAYCFRIVLASPDHREPTAEGPLKTFCQPPHRTRLGRDMILLRPVAKFRWHRKHHECSKPLDLLK